MKVVVSGRDRTADLGDATRRAALEARQAGGTPEAMGGVLYDGLNAPGLAALLHRVVTDAPLRADVLASQKGRVDAILSRSIDTELNQTLAELLS